MDLMMLFSIVVVWAFGPVGLLLLAEDVSEWKRGVTCGGLFFHRHKWKTTSLHRSTNEERLSVCKKCGIGELYTVFPYSMRDLSPAEARQLLTVVAIVG